jgi:hypothetical protein
VVVDGDDDVDVDVRSRSKLCDDCAYAVSDQLSRAAESVVRNIAVVAMLTKMI